MPIFQKPTLKQGTNRKREMPEGLWQKCPECGEVIHNLELSQNLKVCPKCDYHFTFSARERISNLIDEGTFEEFDQNLLSVDVLKFTGVASYSERLESYRGKTGLKDAVVTGFGRLGGHDIGLAVMDFNFLAATMGSAVGEKITRLVEKGTKAGRPIIAVTASGGARVYEGMLSLMQMAKTSAALARHAQLRLPYFVVLTNPTTAGVMASFASLGDIILAEPKCMIGFAGPRVIRETTHQDLPPGFQTAEFLQRHGFIDLIVRRPDLRTTLTRLVGHLSSR
ncbi:MAG: acetyl-CoA carboxylase carboxyltransferase subunit beta [Verrucomicrobia bacterium]|nr:acetyl-CoA carboxylase carboxyltransferase subunit beta [Verrucomicrobiota bacterium]MBV8482531.1 acetyl-CoA carboxylase carboxyltransferase subunit beta [Verrucomicrobiota bacterium]